MEDIESKENFRFESGEYSLRGLGSVAEVLPEAFEHAADRQGLLPRGDAVVRLLSRDLSSVLRAMVERETVRGAIAIDQGMLIDSVGDLPNDGEQLAREIHSTLEAMSISIVEEDAVTGGSH